ncbi:MAG: hypothetical protein ACPGPF_10395, partial [Pontibacterium sp.]
GIAGLIKNFGGEQSKAYKAMFALQKGFAVAQAGLNFSMALGKAFSAGYPLNVPLMAKAATTGLSLIAAVKGAQYQGQAHDGLSRVPASNEGTYLLRKDEMVLNPRQRENFDAMRKAYVNGQGGAQKNISYSFNPVFNIDAKNGADENRLARVVQQSIQEYDRTLQQDFMSNGQRAQLLVG